ncbi:MAG: 50S ribosomal protein L24 [Kiritimatiellae bacterium]|nr:50S ribosomal protein L24 [Kiritimatiellia bacterium]MDW8457500.1 50S ribosomal protein L24 [Verrucomicrobiota bacterium]
MERVRHIKRGDVVYVRSGEHKGKTGKVLRVMPREGLAIVEGVNYVKRHMRKTQDNPKGGIIEREAPLHVSKLVRFDESRAKKAAKPAG